MASALKHLASCRSPSCKGCGPDGELALLRREVVRLKSVNRALVARLVAQGLSAEYINDILRTKGE